MKRKLTNNIGLKIISVIVGILVWLIVVNIDNPVISRSFTLSNVELINEAYIDDTGKVCLRDGEATPVRVTITGTTKLLKGITIEDIRAVADLQQAVSLETDPVMIPITVTCDGIAASNISVSPQNVSVTLEDKVTSEYLVAVNNSSKPGKGYEIGSQTVTPEKVRITGPESLMNKIDKVNVYPNVGGITEDRSEKSELMVIDKNGDILSDVAMSNLKFDNDGTVTVATKLWKIRTDVKLSATYIGEPAEGYVVDRVNTVPETVSVAGTPEALEALKEQGNTLQIQDESLDITDASGDVEQKISIADLLPEGLKLTSGTSDEVLVTATVLPDGGKSYTIPTSQISVVNKPEDLQVSFEIDKIELRVKASSDDVSMDDFDEKHIKASIDLDGREQGTYKVPVTIVLPNGYELIDSVATEVTISEVSTVEND